MSCNNSSSPIDIQISKVQGNCDMKCDYKFKYPKSSLVVTHQNNYVSISYDDTSLPPVVYNSIKYKVNKVKLYSPSIHTFAGNTAAAELIIEHISTQGTNPLFVCIPIIVRDTQSDVSDLLNKIINGLSSNAPSEGESTSVSVDNFSLNLFVPFKPYFAYTGTNFTLPCDQNIDYIVFGLDSVQEINITSTDLTKLNQLISNPGFPIATGTPYFYNKNGPGIPGDGGDDIYIDCKPINQSTEETTIVSGDDSDLNTNININDIVTSPIFQLIIGVLIFLVLLVLVKTGINYFYQQSIEFNNRFS